MTSRASKFYLSSFRIVIMALICQCAFGCSTINGLLQKNDTNPRVAKGVKDKREGLEKKEKNARLENNEAHETDESKEKDEQPPPDVSDKIDAKGSENRGVLVEDPKESSEKIGAAKPDEPQDEAEDSAKASFEKFSHKNYVKKLMKLARELIKEHDDIMLARVCKYFATEDRTLSLYRRKEGAFWHTDYTWDPIERKWVRTFSSPPRKMEDLRSHLLSSQASKDCRILKGRIP